VCTIFRSAVSASQTNLTSSLVALSQTINETFCKLSAKIEYQVQVYLVVDKIILIKLVQNSNMVHLILVFVHNLI